MVKLKKIELEDRLTITEFIRHYPPYNDFEFTSLWTYNPENLNAYGLYNNNLIIRIQDFLTGKFFYSFLGTHAIIETAKTLLEMSKKEGLGNKLYLVPQTVINADAGLKQYFSIQEDPDSFDYILSVEHVSRLLGKSFHDKRNLVHAFREHHVKHSLKHLDFHHIETKAEIFDVFERWEQKNRKNKSDTKMERTAIERLIHLAATHDVHGLGVFSDNKLIGFTCYHIVHDGYAIISFEKGDTSHKGIYEYLNHEAAKHLHSLGVQYINFEQDLGLPGLRKAKTLWRPVHFLKKYTIEG